MATNLAPRLDDDVTTTGGANQMLARMGGQRTLLPLGIAGIALLAVLMLTKWATAPEYVTVVSGLPLDQISEVQSTLETNLIGHKLAGGGTIVQVKSDDLAKARVLLAKDGLVSHAAPGFELFDQNSWGMTEFTQQVNFRRALEGELENTILQFEGIERVDVHLALQDRTFLDSGSQSRASVLLSLRLPGAVDDGTVRAVQRLVSGAVPGIDVDNVSVLDSSGTVLTTEAGVSGLSDQQLQIRESFERRLELKAIELLSAMVGQGNAMVRVSADLNFDQTERTTQSVSPDDQITVREERSEITPGDPSQGAASVQTNTVNETTRQTEQFLQSGPRVVRLSVAVLVNDREIPAGDSVLFQPRTQAELVNIEQLVRNAVGVDAQRGDEISVASAEFERPEFIAEQLSDELDMFTVAKMAERPLLFLMGLGFALFITMRAMKAIPAPPEPVRLAAPAQQPSTPLQLVPDPAPMPARETAPPPPPPPTVADPDMAAKVVRAWMKDA